MEMDYTEIAELIEAAKAWKRTRDALNQDRTPQNNKAFTAAVESLDKAVGEF
jgi:hypothetical protein